MIEFFKHFFGFCGEVWHPNIFNIYAVSGSWLFAMYMIREKILNYINNKNDTKRIRKDSQTIK